MNLFNLKEKYSLFKLNEIGSESSKTMKKLMKHCLRIGTKICLSMPLDVALPKGYRVIIKPNTTNDPDYEKKPQLVNYKKHISISEPMTRDMVIFFTKDLADGLLEEFEDFLNEHPQSQPES